MCLFTETEKEESKTVKAMQTEKNCKPLVFTRQSYKKKDYYNSSINIQAWGN